MSRFRFTSNFGIVPFLENASAIMLISPLKQYINTRTVSLF